MTEVTAVWGDPSWDRAGMLRQAAARELLRCPPCSPPYWAQVCKRFNHVPSHLEERATQKFSIFGCPKTQLWEFGGLFLPGGEDRPHVSPGLHFVPLTPAARLKQPGFPARRVSRARSTIPNSAGSFPCHSGRRPDSSSIPWMSAEPPCLSNEATGLGAATIAADFNILGSYGSLAALPTRGVRKDRTTFSRSGKAASDLYGMRVCTAGAPPASTPARTIGAQANTKMPTLCPAAGCRRCESRVVRAAGAGHILREARRAHRGPVREPCCGSHGARGQGQGAGHPCTGHRAGSPVCSACRPSPAGPNAAPLQPPRVGELGSSSGAS